MSKVEKSAIVLLMYQPCIGVLCEQNLENIVPPVYTFKFLSKPVRIFMYTMFGGKISFGTRLNAGKKLAIPGSTASAWLHPKQGKLQSGKILDIPPIMHIICCFLQQLCNVVQCCHHFFFLFFLALKSALVKCYAEEVNKQEISGMDLTVWLGSGIILIF